MSRTAWAYIWGVLLSAVALGALACPGHMPASSAWLTCAALTVLATAALLFKAFFTSSQRSDGGSTSYSPFLVFSFAGVLVLPPALFVALVVISHALEWAKERLTRSASLRAWYIQPFNIATHVIAGCAAGWAFSVIRPGANGHVSAAAVAAALLAAFIYVAVNHVLVGQVLVLARGVSWRESGVLNRDTVLPDGVMVCLGYAIALLWSLNPWVIVPALSPLVLIYQALLVPQLKQEAQSDGKTGLANARHFNATATAEIERARRFQRPLAFIMADLDLLRDINNTYGHLAGDTVLAGVGQVIRETIREYDIAGRFGGEEFAIALPETTPGEALALAERIRRAVESARFDIAANALPVHATMSLGIACFPGDASTLTDLIHAADLAVYQAKFRGRNRVVCATDVPHALIPETAPAALGSGASREVPLERHPACSDAGSVQPVGSSDKNLAMETEITPAAGMDPGRAPTDPAFASLDSPAPPERAAAGPAVAAENGTTRASAPEAGTARPVVDGARVPVADGTRDTSAAAGPAPRTVLPLFVGTVITAALGVTVLSSLFGAPPPLGILGLLVGLALLFELAQVNMYGRSTVSVSVAVGFAAALTTGLSGMALVAAAIALAHFLRVRPALYKTAFNWATHVLAGAVPAFLVGMTGIRLQLPDLPLLTLVAGVGAVAYYLIETGFIATAISLSSRTPLAATWRAQFQWLLPHYMGLCAMGLFLGIAATTFGPGGGVVFTLPILLMRYAEQQYVGRTETSMRELERMNEELMRANDAIVAAGRAEHARLERAALTDSLTDLGNHRAYQEALQRAIAHAVGQGETVTLARIDLDEFKAINDQQGHGHGDRILTTLATVLRSDRGDGEAFRLEGDEFALILPRTTQVGAVNAMEHLRQEAQRQLLGATVSIGIASLTPDESESDLLHDQATAALDEAKRSGRNAVVTFDSIKDRVSVASSARAHAVRRLLLERKMTVAFQPIWDLRGGRILAFEALTRPAAEYGFAGPQEAFDLAERIGRAHDLDALCREAILARAHELPPDVLLFLNVSPQTLDHDLLAGTSLVEAVTAAGLTPDRLVLELTERSMARLPVLVREVKRLRGLGFKVALDDTGAGNAGLEMLSQVPVDVIKIDRSVVGAAMTDKAARGVLAGIIALASETDTYVIAEGIEDAAMLDLVRGGGVPHTSLQRGVHGVQGYFLGRPSQTIPTATALDECTALLRAA